MHPVMLVFVDYYDSVIVQAMKEFFVCNFFTPAIARMRTHRAGALQFCAVWITAKGGEVMDSVPVAIYTA